MYSVTLWYVRVGIVIVESQQLVSFVFYTYICCCKLIDIENPCLGKQQYVIFSFVVRLNNIC
jgi:hypothetical protein